MNELRKERLNRREFLRTCGRYGILAGLAAVAAVLAGRKPQQGGSIETCVSKTGCRGCRVLAQCNLPQAMSARRVLKG